jgi:hypothetical protein
MQVQCKSAEGKRYQRVKLGLKKGQSKAKGDGDLKQKWRDGENNVSANYRRRVRRGQGSKERKKVKRRTCVENKRL